MLDRYLVIEFILFFIVATGVIRHTVNMNNKPRQAEKKIHNKPVKDHLNKYIA